MRCANKYGGDLVAIPLTNLMVKGKGDEIEIVNNSERMSHFGSLDLEAYKNDFYLAVDYTAMDDIVALGAPVMIGIQDPESGSPMLLGRCVERNGKRYYLAAIFNASFVDDPRPNYSGSFCLKVDKAVDPHGVFSERIAFSPGGLIYWNNYQLKDLALENKE